MWIDDELFMRSAEPFGSAVWIPESPMVILGNSNRPEIECHQDQCHLERVPILKRCGGGGTVVLHSGCVVVGFFAWVDNYYDNHRYFRLLNDSVISALAGEWKALAALDTKGISDIAWREQKVAGTSLFRSRNFLLYQASVLIDGRVELLERFLKHPSREPEYRAGKSHRDFVIGLNEVLEGLSMEEVVQCLRQRFQTEATEKLREDLIEPQCDQFGRLMGRAKTNSS